MQPLAFWKSFSFRCTFFCLTVFFVPALLLTLDLYRESEKLSRKETGKLISSNIKNIADSYEEVLKNIGLYHFQPMNDKNFLSYGNITEPFMTDYERMNTQNEIEKAIKFYLMTTRELDSIYLYHSGTEDFHNYSLYYRSPSPEFSVDKAEKISRFIGEQENRKFYLRQELYSNKPVITNSSRINLFMPSDDPIYFSINLDFSGLAERIRNSLPKPVTFFISDAEGNTAHIDENGEIHFIDAKFSYFPQPGEIKVEDLENNTLLCSYRVNYSELIYRAQVPLSGFNSTPELIRNFMISLFSSLLVILFVILLFSFYYVISPIKRIYQAMGKVESGDLLVRIAITRNDELGYIQKEFNRMLESIQNLISENYEYTMRRQEMELKYIHTQINEHFLYNTLDSVHWIAQKKHVPEISHIIFNLSKFYRLTLSGGNEQAPVSSILQMLNAYIDLINIRMDRPIRLECHADDAVYAEPVLKYIFQPLLENAIYHGLKPASHDGIVHIYFSRDKSGGILFRITDNGVGIDRLTLKRLQRCLNGSPDYSGSFFALKNIQKQLELYYKESTVFTIESEWGKGTEVTILLPEIGGTKDAL